jgi:hypothetical protein
MMDINTFLTTYQTFTTTPQLIKKLLQRYQVPEKSFEKVEEQKQFTVNVVRPIQLRVSKLLKLIIDTNYREILMEEDLLNVIRSFVRGFVDQPALSKQIQTSVCANGVSSWLAKWMPALTHKISLFSLSPAPGHRQEALGRATGNFVATGSWKDGWNYQGYL